MDQPTELTTFDLFILALSMFSIANILWLIIPTSDQTRNVVLIIDTTCSIGFLIDFFLRLDRARARTRYFLAGQGWLLLIGSLPFPPLRLARIPEMVRVSRSIRRDGGRALLRRMMANRAGSSLLVAVSLTIVVLQYASMAVLRAENGQSDANIRSASDAVWWSYVTITTVGYGDEYPVTPWGRIVGILLLSTGVGLFAVITGFLANSFLSPARKREAEISARREEVDDRLRRLDELIARLTPDTRPPASEVLKSEATEDLDDEELRQ